MSKGFWLNIIKGIEREQKEKNSSRKVAIMNKAKANRETPPPEPPVSRSAPVTPVKDNPRVQNTITVINNLQANIRVHSNHWHWHTTVLLFFGSMLLMSFGAYSLTQRFMITPSYNTLMKFMNSNINFEVENLLDINFINIICDNYRTTYEMLDNDTVPIVLGVDALSLVPDVKINKKDGKITGLVNNLNITNEQKQVLVDNINLQEKLIKSFKNLTIKAAFVYYAQPLNPVLPCFPVHFNAAVDGKANETEKNLLIEISARLRLNNFKVISYSADGDSGYQSLIDNNLHSQMIDRPVLDFSTPLFISDPLHLLKRGRYSLLANKLVPLKKTENPIDQKRLKEILNLPSVVFDNSKITKMHDKLPLQLFTIENFFDLDDYSLHKEAAYFLPFALLIEAIDDNKLEIGDRVDFLEICAYYLMMYKNISSETSSREKAAQNGSKNGKKVMFPYKFIDDLLTTVISINTILIYYNDTLSMNRLGTNPIEHHFGLLRLKAKYKNSFSDIINSEKKIGILREIEQRMLNNLVSGRKKSFGSIISLNGNDYGSSTLSNKRTAYALLKRYHFPTNKLHFRAGSCVCEQAIEYFFMKIDKVISRRTPKRRRYFVNSKDFTVGISSSTIRERYIKDEIIPEHEGNDETCNSHHCNSYNSESYDTESDLSDDDWKRGPRRQRSWSQR